MVVKGKLERHKAKNSEKWEEMKEEDGSDNSVEKAADMDEFEIDLRQKRKKKF